MKNWAGHFKKTSPVGDEYGEALNLAYLGFTTIGEGKLNSAKHHLNRLKTMLPYIERLPANYRIRPNRYAKLLYAEVLFSEDSLTKAISIYQKMAPSGLPGGGTKSRIRDNFPIL